MTTLVANTPGTPSTQPEAPAEKEIPDGARAEIDERKWLLLRAGLVLVALGLGLAVDLGALEGLASAGHVLRFVVFLTVSIAGSQWWPWLAASAVFSVVWLLLVLLDLDLLQELRLLVGLLARNVGHLEAAFVWTAIAASIQTDTVLFAFLAAIYALGLTVTAMLGRRLIDWWIPFYYRHERRSGLSPEERARRIEERKRTKGNLAAGRRVVISLATVVGYLVLFVFHWHQAHTLVPLFLAVLGSIVLRLVVLGAISFRTDDPDGEVTQRALQWAKYCDLPVTAIACVAIYGTRALPVAGALADEGADRARRKDEPAAVADPGDARRGVSLFIVSDSQFHELRGERSGVHLDIVDGFVPVAVRPVELDLLSGVPFHHFGELYGMKKGGWKDTEGKDPQWAHLGDLGDLGCWSELFRAEDYLLDFGAHGELAALVPGNHDSTFFGNFAWHPDWETACRRVGPKPDAREAWKLLPPSKQRVNQWLGTLMNDMQVGAKSRVPNAHAGGGSQQGRLTAALNADSTSMVSFRDLGTAGASRVVGAFLDTSDYAERVLGVAGAQGTIPERMLGALKHALCPPPEPHGGAPEGTYWKHKVVLFLHHPRSALSSESQQHLYTLADCLGDRLLALVSAHTHLAERRRWSARDVPELVVGSMLDPPQEAALLTISPDGAVRLETIPAVRRGPESPPDAPLEEATTGDCRMIYAELDDQSRRRDCEELMRLPILHEMAPHPDDVKRRQQVRAARLLKCLAIVELDDKAEVPFDGTCPRGATARTCPLNAPDLYDKIDAVVWDREGRYAKKRRELLCMARAGALLQGHKKEGWSFGRALQHAGDPTADEAPIVIQCPPGSGECKAVREPTP